MTWIPSLEVGVEESKGITEVVSKLLPLTNVCIFKSLPVTGNLAAGTVPDDRLDAFKLVILEPLPDIFVKEPVVADT